MAGIIAATLNNSTGIAGIAPEVPDRCNQGVHGSSGGCPSGAVAHAITEAANTHGAKIINLSLWCDKDPACDVQTDPKCENIVEMAIEKAVTDKMLSSSWQQATSAMGQALPRISQTTPLPTLGYKTMGSLLQPVWIQ